MDATNSFEEKSNLFLKQNTQIQSRYLYKQIMKSNLIIAVLQLIIHRYWSQAKLQHYDFFSSNNIWQILSKIYSIRLQI